MGAPTKCTPEVQRTLVQAIALGSPLTLACKAAGISYDCYNDWQHRAQAGRQPYVQLFQDLEKAEGQRVTRWLGVIEKATQDSWQAAAWKLERIYPEQYGQRQKVEMDVNIAWEELETHELERLAAGPSRAAAYQSPRPPRITEKKAS